MFKTVTNTLKKLRTTLIKQTKYRFSSSNITKQLSSKNISPFVLRTEYAVRGPIVIRANEIEEELLNNPNHKYPFKKLIMCNIGNPQALNQLPLTYHRQVLAGCLYPELVNKKIFPNDINDRILNILNDLPCGTVGAYTHSQGNQYSKEKITEFIAQRDGSKVKPDPQDIFLSNGASSGIKAVLQCLISNPTDGILLPIPQYPLYSASISLLNGKQLGYYTNESNGWGFKIKSAQQALDNAKKEGIKPKGIVVINPGNPTGNCLLESDIIEVIKLAKQESLVILADEVYQENIYNEKRPFISFSSVLDKMGNDYKDVELCSFHSTSKGILGECGLRGGYMHLKNIDPSGHEQLYKLVSISLCPNTIGQITIGLMCDKPKKGDESYELFRQEYDTLYQSLKRRADKLSKALNSIDGINCQEISGAMYAFPTIRLPEKAVTEAKSKGKSPDGIYCMELLENTGICCVPGSGFGQKDGTFHLRTTILPPENEIDEAIELMDKFHTQYVRKYS